ncbi:hypothetical protein C8Q77DRAFT_1218114 [Trametes polyzona]|nr:hypothetical protein C8Q77DRAFT_1218114 [Trametes polyzona]
MLGLSSKSATVALLLLFLGVVHAAPLATEKRTFDTSVRVARDEDNISQPTTVQTTNVIQTAVGPMVQTCTIKLEPITGDDGKPLVRETKSCSISMPGNGNNASGSNGSSSGSSDSGSNSSSSDSASATQASSSADSSKATQTEASASGKQAPALPLSSLRPSHPCVATEGSASATATASGANGSSEVPGSALSSGATDSGAATATGSNGSAQASPTATSGSGAGAVSAGSAVATETGASASASATASGTASASATPAPSGTGTAVGDAAGSPSSASSAADTAESSPAASFQLPGTKLQVLPIGLGVFAGISVIALIVVGLVTYERTKYRKAFRQRKLAESGAAMGYSGMA